MGLKVLPPDVNESFKNFAMIQALKQSPGGDATGQAPKYDKSATGQAMKQSGNTLHGRPLTVNKAASLPFAVRNS